MNKSKSKSIYRKIVNFFGKENIQEVDCEDPFDQVIKINEILLVDLNVLFAICEEKKLNPLDEIQWALNEINEKK